MCGQRSNKKRPAFEGLNWFSRARACGGRIGLSLSGVYTFFIHCDRVERVSDRVDLSKCHVVSCRVRH